MSSERTAWPRHDAAHQAFDDLMRAAVTRTADPVALAVLAEVLAHAVRAHAHLEEATVLPLYAQRCPDIPDNGARTVVERDHAILLRRLDALCEAALWALAVPMPPVVLADRVDAVKSTLEHHDEREHRYVYRLLRDAISDAERAALDAALPAVPSATAALDAAAALASDPQVASILHTYRRWAAREPATAPSFPAAPGVLQPRPARAAHALAELAARRLDADPADARAALPAHHAWRAPLRLAVREVARALATPSEAR